MIHSSESIEKVVEFFSSLPTIGRKTAQRLTFHLLRQPEEFIKQFSAAMIDMKHNIRYCSLCFNYTEIDPCPICSSPKRNNRIICVVEDPKDVAAIEKTNDYFGFYHVLHGVLNPLDGISPNELRVKELLGRLDGVEEIILALNPSIEGEVTTQYIARLVKPLGIKTTRIAHGIPLGSALEFSDEATLSRALEGRVVI